MTRLTPDMIEGVPDDRICLDSQLMRSTGRTVRDIALEAAGLPKDTDLSHFRVACVPVTSGEGVIGGFSESLRAIIDRLGMQGYITKGTDVDGFAEAVAGGADIVMMADDTQFVAYNVREGKFTDNSWGTARGYAFALRDAAGGLEGKDVLVVGAGRVGTWAVWFLREMGANVHVTDVVYEKAERLSKLGAIPLKDVEKAISENTLVLNAAPFIIPGEVIAEGSIISSPGVPHRFDEIGRRRARAIIHDPLEIGSAVMAVNSAGFSIARDSAEGITSHASAVVGMTEPSHS